MPVKRKYTIAWVTLVALGTAIELLAITDDEPGATASAHIRALTRSKPGKMVVGATLGWLGVHLLVPPGSFRKGFHRANPYRSANRALRGLPRAHAGP